MTTRYFNVKGGIQTGNVVIEATSGNFTGIGNITIISTASANLGNAATANYFLGNGIYISNIAGANVSGQVGNATVAGTVYTNAQPNITSVGTLSSLSVTGNITSGNASLGNLVSASYFSGDGSLLSSINGSNVTGTIANATYATTAGTVTTNAQPNITSTGTLSGLTAEGTINFTTASNVSLGNISNLHISGGSSGYVLQTNGSGGLTFVSAGSTGIAGTDKQVQFNDGGSFGASANFTFDKTTKTLTVDQIAGNGSGITYVTGSNVNGNVSSAVQSHYANIANSVAGSNVSGQVGNAAVAGTVYTNAQPNITSLGTLSSLDVTGNANVGNFVSTGTGSFSGNVTLNTYYISNVADPLANQDVATKKYVDGLVSTGLYYHSPVVAATTTDLDTTTGGTVSYNNGTSGVNANLVTTGSFNLIDTANVQTVGTRILVKNESNAAWNGIYEWANATTIVRTTDADSYGPGTGDLSLNDYFFVSGGNFNKGSAYVVTTTGTIVFGTTNITFSEFSSSQVYSAGTGLSLTNLTFSVNASQTQITSVGTLTALTVSGNITSGNASLGNLASASYFSGNGSLLSSITGANVTGTVANATYATSAGSATSATSATTAGTVTTNAQPNITSTGTLVSLTVSGNLTSGNADLGNLATASYFSGNGIYISNIAGANVSGTVANATYATSAGSATTAGTVTTNAQPNITSVGTLAGLTANGTIDFTTTSNVSLGAVGNVHITGGTSGQVLRTDGSGGLSWVSISSSSISNGTSNVSIPTSDGNVVIGVSGNAAIMTVTGTGANISGYLNVGSGAITGGNITAGNVAGGNLVSANYLSGDGSYLTNITGGNVTGNVASAVQAHYANIANSVAGANVTGQVGNALVAGTVYTNAQPNITSVGTLSNLSVTGNIIAGNVSLNGGLTSNRTNVAVTTNTIIDEFAPGTYRTAKYIISASGDDGYQSVETLLVHDGASSYITIYGSVCSNTSADIIELTSNIASGNVRVYATSASVNANVNLLVTYLKT